MRERGVRVCVCLWPDVLLRLVDISNESQTKENKTFAYITHEHRYMYLHVPWNNRKDRQTNIKTNKFGAHFRVVFCPFLVGNKIEEKKKEKRKK